MIIIMDIKSSQQQVDQVVEKLETSGFQAHLIFGVKRIVIGAVGDRGAINSLGLEGMPGVVGVVPIMRPYKLVSKLLAVRLL